MFLVSNEERGLLSREHDQSRRDAMPLLESAGFEVVVDEPAIADPAVRRLLRIEDRHVLLRR